jgi:hypothetical protein
MLGFCPTVVNKTPLRSLRWGFRHDTTGGSKACFKVKNLLFHDAAEFPLRRDGLKEIFSDEEVFRNRRSGAGVHGFIVRSTMKSLVKIHTQRYGM